MVHYQVSKCYVRMLRMSKNGFGTALGAKWTLAVASPFSPQSNLAS